MYDRGINPIIQGIVYFRRSTILTTQGTTTINYLHSTYEDLFTTRFSGVPIFHSIRKKTFKEFGK
jgi:hypothetical protein